MKMEFTLHCDGGHGWLKVPMKILHLFGRDIINKISSYSYMDTDYGIAYLEEDCDAGLFIKHLQENYGIKLKISEHYVEGNSPIRNLSPFNHLYL